MLLLKYMLVYERGLSVVIVFFFKQNTSYELRISDWSSDVCSSDLSSCRYNIVTRAADRRQAGLCGRHVWKKSPPGRPGGAGNCGNLLSKMPFSRRSEERRVGTECVCKCRSRGSPYLLTENTCLIQILSHYYGTATDYETSRP